MPHSIVAANPRHLNHLHEDPANRMMQYKKIGIDGESM
jgi:hypothetical protein